MKVRLLFAVLLVSGVAAAQTTGATPTQFVMNYTAGNTSNCTIEVSESNTYSPLVNAVNSTLFTGASSDGQTNAGARTLVVGRRTVKVALDSNYYSLALQNNTTHYFRITGCAATAASGDSVVCSAGTCTGQFTTANLARGNTYGEPLPLAVDASNNFIPGRFAYPTVSDTTRNQSFIDPVYGTKHFHGVLHSDDPGHNFIGSPDAGNQWMWAKFKIQDSGGNNIQLFSVQAGGGFGDIYGIVDGTGEIRFYGMGLWSGYPYCNNLANGGGSTLNMSPAAPPTLWGACNRSYGITAFSITSNVVTFTASNALNVGDKVYIDNLQVGGYLNGQYLTVATASSTQFTANFTHANVGNTSDTGTIAVEAYLTSCQMPASGNTYWDTSVAGGTYITCTPTIYPSGSPQSIPQMVHTFESSFPLGTIMGMGVDEVQSSGVHTYILMHGLIGVQDTIGWNAVYDVNAGAIVAAQNIYASPLQRWCAYHTPHQMDQTGVGWSSYTIKDAYGGSGLGNGPYSMFLNMVSGMDASTSPLWITVTNPGGGASFPEPQIYGPAWSGSNAYSKHNIVSYSGNMYEAFYHDVVAGHGSPDTNYADWKLIPNTSPNAIIYPIQVGDLFYFANSEVDTVVSAATCSQTQDATHLCVTRSGMKAQSNNAQMTMACGNNNIDFNAYGYPLFWNFLQIPNPQTTPPNANNTSQYLYAQSDGYPASGGFSGHQSFGLSSEITEGGWNYCPSYSPGATNPGPTKCGASYPTIGITAPFNSFARNCSGNACQQHPTAARQSLAAASEQVWAVDTPPEQTDCGMIPSSVSSVVGTTYLYKYVTNGACPTWTGFNATGSLTKAGILAAAGVKGLLDVSAPSSVLNDTIADNYKMCIAHNGNECRTGSSAGDVYINLPSAPNGCAGYQGNHPGYVLNTDTTSTCISTKQAYANTVTQVGYKSAPATGIDNTGQYVRSISTGLMPWQLWDPNANAHQSIDGQWIAYGYQNADTGVLSTMVVKVPSWPATDGTSRNTFLSASIPVTTATGATQARIAYGYAENGPSSSLYCTSYQAKCYYKSGSFGNTTASNFTSVALNSTATPAILIPDRVLYYQVEYLDAGNNVVGTGSVLPLGGTGSNLSSSSTFNFGGVSVRGVVIQ